MGVTGFAGFSTLMAAHSLTMSKSFVCGRSPVNEVWGFNESTYSWLVVGGSTGRDLCQRGMACNTNLKSSTNLNRSCWIHDASWCVSGELKEPRESSSLPNWKMRKKKRPCLDHVWTIILRWSICFLLLLPSSEDFPLGSRTKFCARASHAAPTSE